MNTASVSPADDLPAAIVQPAGTTETKKKGQPSFSSVEWQLFRCEDKRATAAIAGILTTCFTLGLLGYMAIALWRLWTD
jgi:hypothetical protein